jgi:hypothetical protein
VPWVNDLLQYHVLTFGYQYNRNSSNTVVQRKRETWLNV